MSEIHTESINNAAPFCMDLFDDDDEHSEEICEDDEAPISEDTVATQAMGFLNSVLAESAGDIPPFQRNQEMLFRELISQHQRKLYRFVIKYIDHPDDAADITQQAFVEAARTISSFRGESKLSTWLFGIAMNMVRNYQMARYTVTATVFSAIIKEVSDSLKGTANKIG